MGANSFNKMEIDAIGEIMNISLGASATAVSTMLGAKVNITTPHVEVQTKEEFEFQRLEPAIGVEISYTQGLEGKNIMMFRKDDVRIIVGMLMGQEDPEDQFELGEIQLSAICEVMNQMMGSSATALSEFLGTAVNISTPVSFEIKDSSDFKDKYFSDPEGMVVVRFQLEIEGKLKSEFMNIMSISLTKRLLQPFADTIEKAEKAGNKEQKTDSADGSKEAASSAETAPAASKEPEASAASATSAPSQEIQSSEEPEQVKKTAPSVAAEEPSAASPQPETPVQPAASIPPQEPAGISPSAGPVPAYTYAPAADPAMLQLLAQMQQTQVQMMELMRDMKKEEAPSKEPSVIRPLHTSNLTESQGEGQEEKANQEMLMTVPLEVSVEIGRTKKLVRDILEFTQGSLVVLDKMAGEQVDLFVNGQCIAKGDIVVVEDNFGIRITEIVAGGWSPENL